MRLLLLPSRESSVVGRGVVEDADGKSLPGGNLEFLLP